MGGAGLLATAGQRGHAFAPGRVSLEVFHGWASSSERLALFRLQERALSGGLAWQSMAPVGTSGVHVETLLRSRLLRRQPPDLAQLSPRSVRELAAKGVLLDLGREAAWVAALHPQVRSAIAFGDGVWAVPMGVHRINTVLWNARLWDEFALPPPLSWADFYRASAVLARQGVAPVVWSDEGSQLRVLFESLLMVALGPRRFERLFSADGWEDDGVPQALDHLRHLRSLFPRPTGGAPTWPQAGREFLLGRAGMWVTGDWARGELEAWGLRPGVDFRAAAVPGTEQAFVFSVDLLAAFVREGRSVQSVRGMAAELARADVQRVFSRAKGALPAAGEPALEPSDPVGAGIWQAFQDERVMKLPGLSHWLGMEGLRKELTGELLAAFVRDPKRSTLEVWEQLVRLNRGVVA